MRSSLPSKNFVEALMTEDLAHKKYPSIQTRFPPEPNGFLHLGHAKSICLNFGLAKKFGGLCTLRFDDTNPLTEEQLYIDAIQEDVAWLGFQWSKLCYASDYFEFFYTVALRLIRQGAAYVDEQSLESVRRTRGSLTTPGELSPYRKRSVEENLQCFEKMKAGGYPSEGAVLRARIDMHSPYMILRDPILYRIKFATHHQTGDRWCLYPMYDFAHCLSDLIEAVSHSLCTLEFQNNRRLYDWILDQLDVPVRPYQHEFARLQLERTVLSKRQLQRLVLEKVVEGWDDPRMPTLSGLRRRGYPAEAIRLFCSRIGVSRQDSVIEQGALESCVREVLNRTAARRMGVVDPILLILENWDADVETLTLPNHPNDPTLGTRSVRFGRALYLSRADVQIAPEAGYKRLTIGGVVRLRYAYVIRATRVTYDEQGRLHTVYAHCLMETLGQKPKEAGSQPKGVIHWVYAPEAQAAQFRFYDPLFLDTRVDPGQDAWETSVNPESCRCYDGIVEAGLTAERPEVFQFEREGYFCIDPRLSDEHTLCLHQTVSLKEDAAGAAFSVHY